MRQKLAGIILALAIFMLLSTGVAAAACTFSDTPRLAPIKETILLYEGREISQEIYVENMNKSLVTLSYGVVEGVVSNIRISNGYIRIIGSENDTRNAIIAIIAYRNGCTDVTTFNTTRLSKPTIIRYTPVESGVLVEEGEPLTFSIITVTTNPDKRVNYDWFMDNKRIDGAKRSSYTLVPALSPNGNRTLSVSAYDYYGMADTHNWSLTITKNNRQPFLKTEIPAIVLYKNTRSEGFDLDAYFDDPENDKLSYTWQRVLPTYENLSYANISVSIAPDGTVIFDPQTGILGTAYFLFNATDPFGQTVQSNTVKVDVIEPKDTHNVTSIQTRLFCGDYSCNNKENCTICPEDCGACAEGSIAGCNPQWNCTDWNPCQPEGYRERTCKDDAACDDNRTIPPIWELCIYNATCEDGLANGLEEGVDCGLRACNTTCPNCTDKVMNGEEEGIDCGILACNITCPSCTNGIRDGKESDVDCGGECPGCAGDKSCTTNFDCDSLKCSFLNCTFATCFDQTKNQGELGIDCEGPCPVPCHTCYDSIMNGNEEGVDCGGGSCKPCESCKDGIRNQDEWLVDCGGRCGMCMPINYWRQFRASILMLLALTGFILLDILVYFVYLMNNPEKAEKLYESNTFFVSMTGFHNFFRVVRKLFGKKPFLRQEQYIDLRNKIAELASKDSYTNSMLHETIHDVLGNIFGLPGDFDDKSFFTKVKQTPLTPFIKVLIVGFYKKTAILLSQKYVPSEESEAFLAELKYLLLELSKP